MLTATVTENGAVNESPLTQTLEPVAPVPTVKVDDAVVPTVMAVTWANSAVVVAVAPFGPVSVVYTA